MKLTEFRIQNYKVIDDTDWVPVDEHVTALVGKNESGKTAIMKALWKSRNVAGAKFDKLYDYPRDRYAKERKGTQEVVALKFQLDNGEAAKLSEQFPFSLKGKPKEVVFRTSYAGEDETKTSVSFEDAIEKQCARSAKDGRKVMEALAGALTKAGVAETSSIEQSLADTLKKIDENAPLWEPQAVAALDAFNTAVTNWIGTDEARSSAAVDERKQLAESIRLAKQGDPSVGARKWVETNLPVFIYFSDYGQLETRIHLPTHLKSRTSTEEKTRTQAALFEWSNLDPKEILELGARRGDNEAEAQVQRRLEKRRALLSSASFSLTGDWVKWWDERSHQLHFDADAEDLVLQVSDEHNQFPIPFEERSHGFQWFFSFYLVFLVESQKAHKGAILLLDEPGLHLHPTLQSKLIALFERISHPPDPNQLLYSTHLPFLVDGDHLQRVRTVHVTEQAPKKTIVSNDVRPTGDRDTLFPLQAAVGYSIAQTLFIGKRSVVVEGITDYWFLKALNDCLAALGAGPGLHEDTVLIPAGGTSRLMPLASIMLSTTGVDDRRMLVLLDSDQGGNQAGKHVRELFGGDDSRILMLGPAIGQAHATIEDLVPRNIYAEAVSEATGRVCKLSNDEQNEPTNVSAVEKLFIRQGWGKFGVEQKAAAALKLIDKWGKDPPAVPEATKQAALNLFEAINAKFAA